MVRSGFLWLLLAGAADILSPCNSMMAEAKAGSGPTFMAGNYVVEFEEAQDSAEFFNHVGPMAETRMTLDYPLFKGASIQFNNLESAEEEAAKLASLSSVRRVWQNKIYPGPSDEVVWRGAGGEGYIQNVKRQIGNETFRPHLMTQVDKLRAKGVTGAGVKIAIIDTGLDYTHPALGGCFGPNCMVSFGADLVGDTYAGGDIPKPDPDPMDDCNGHGTHVAGTIASGANLYGFTGAAPGVTLGIYRVLGCSGAGASTDVLIDAYMKAFEAGANIITASIGGSSGWSEDPWSVAVSRIVEAGVPCTVSAGNDGAMGLFYSSGAANGKRVTAIASFDNEMIPLLLTESSFSVNGSAAETFGYSLGEPANWTGIELPLYTPSFDTSETAMGCDPFPAGTPDLSGHIVLIKRGSCNFSQKAANAVAAGAKYLVFYNNVAGAVGPSVTMPGIAAIGGVTQEQGMAWAELMKSGANVTLNMLDPKKAPVALSQIPNKATGGYASLFTSWNPNNDMTVKPQLAAPGGMILSTYPVALGSFAVLSGTSMACPLAAAIFALLSNVHGTFDPATLENMLSATASPQFLNNGNTTMPFLAPVVQQGAGIIQAFDAAYTTTLLDKSSLGFNDTDNFEPSLDFTITNKGTGEVTYNLGSIGAATAYTFSDSIYPDVFPGLELTGEYATVNLSESKVVIPAGGNAKITVRVTPPAVNGARLPVYSGYITINGTNGDNLSIPYNGAVGSLKNTRVLDKGHLSLSTDAEMLPVSGDVSFVLPKTTTTNANITYPMAVMLMAFGSPRINAKVIPAGYQGIGELGNMFGFPVLFWSRDPLSSNWDGRLEDGTFAPAGKYKIRIEALHIFGDPNKPADYDITETIPFDISYA